MWAPWRARARPVYPPRDCRQARSSAHPPRICAPGSSARAVASTFPEREQLERIITPTTPERAAIDAVEAYGQMVLHDAQGHSTQIIAGWAVMHLHKRAFSSPEALRKSLRNRSEGLKRRLQSWNEAASEAAVSEEGEAVPVAAARAMALDSDPGERLTEEEAAQRLERGFDAAKTPGREALELIMSPEPCKRRFMLECIEIKTPLFSSKALQFTWCDTTRRACCVKSSVLYEMVSMHDVPNYPTYHRGQWDTNVL